MPGTVLSKHSRKENRQGLLFLVMKGSCPPNKKRHWTSLKGKAWNEPPGHTRKLSFCSVVIKRVKFRKGLEKHLSIHSTNHH